MGLSHFNYLYDLYALSYSSVLGSLVLCVLSWTHQTLPGFEWDSEWWTTQTTPLTTREKHTH